MKTKLFRIVSLLFVLSSVLNLVVFQPTHADATTDKEAVDMIATCKGGLSVADPNSKCGKYAGCLAKQTTDLCKAVKRLNGVVPALPPASMVGCQKAQKTADDCNTAYGVCIYNRIKSDKISDDDVKTCTDLIAKGDTTGAMKDPGPADGKTSCVIDGVGWLICPVMNFLALVVDGAYAFVSSLMTVQPLLTTNLGTNPIYQAWSLMRNFANVAFVIAFLVIILSQVSSIGISNYGIKKMLPRLVVAAVLVNVSYWICAIAVDVSNILGIGFGDLFKNMKATLALPDPGAFGGAGVGWAGITKGVLAGLIAGTIVYMTISALLPALVLALLAIVTVFLVLTLRQALIILLIVVSPLAFVAYLLPNTESLFKKWRSLLQTLLLMYPIISIVFGASALASQVVMGSANGPYKIIIQIMGALMSIIPLALTPIIMKTAGGLLNRFGGIINNPNKGPFDNLRKKAEGTAGAIRDTRRGARLTRGDKILGGSGAILGGEYSRRRRAASMLGSGFATTSVNSAQKQGFAKAVSEENAQNYFAKRALADEGFAEGIAGSEAKATSLKAGAQTAVDKILKQDVANRKVLLEADVEFKNNPQEALKQALAKKGGGDRVQANAAMSMLMESGTPGFDKIHSSLAEAENNGTGGTPTMEAARDFIKQNGQAIKAKDPSLTSWASQDRSKGAAQTLADVAKDKGNYAKSNAEVAGFAPDALKRAATAGAITSTQAEAILGNTTLIKDVSPKNIETLTIIKNGGKINFNG